RIILSHTRTWEDEKNPSKKENTGKKPANNGGNKGGEKAPKIALEKTTLGDLEVLAKLKDSMENKNAAE
ncbi:MAG: 30S ribosomal protein S1, partial [Bacteroidales bacterium]|nr:30S ribosomal protein S1 [Bacteroidales bacterium]